MSALRDFAKKSRPASTVTEGPALWRGEVVEVLANGLVWVMVPGMGGQDPIGPINSIPTGLLPGDRVVVGSIGRGVNDLIVMSLTVARPTPPAPHRHTYADIDGVIPTSALPPLAVIDTFTAGSQAEMLALTAQRGDMCIRTDTFLTFVLATDDPTKLVNWKTITAAGQVTSVNGKTGTVQLVTDDINGLTTALAGKANVMHTHDITAIIGWAETLTPPAGTTTLMSLTAAGTYYFTTAQSGLLTDRPATFGALPFLLTNSARGTVLKQTLTRNSSTASEEYYRTTTGAAGGTSSWNRYNLTAV